MKVLHIVTGLNAGGAEQQLRLLLREMPPDIECEVLTLENPGVIAAGLRADGVRVTHLDMRGNRDLRALGRLTRQIRAGGYDLVHCHLYRACVYGRIAARLAGVRTVLATEHSLLGTVLEGRRVNAGVRLLYLATERLGRATIAVSADVARRLADWGVPEDRIHVIPNGVDARRYLCDDAGRAAGRAALREQLGIAADAFTIGAVGRLVPGKRFDILVRALAELPPRAVLLVAGAGPEAGPLAALAEELGLAERVLMLGEREDVPELLAAVDVLAAPSEGETFGLALVEGLAAGLPVLWSSGPALAELPPDAAPHARYVPATPAAYAAALTPLLAAPARPHPQPPAVATYDIARLAPQTAALYRALLDEDGTAAGSVPGTRTAAQKEKSHA